MHEVLFQKDLLSPNNYKDFEKEFARTVPYALGCTSFKLIKTTMSDSKFTEKRFSSFVNKNKNKEKESPKSYSANCYDMGLDHWEIWQNKVKIIEHKRREVQVRKCYKSKPKAIPKGAVLKEIHRYKCDLDYRYYDPLEHGGISKEEFLKNSFKYIKNRFNLLPIEKIELKNKEIEITNGR